MNTIKMKNKTLRILLCYLFITNFAYPQQTFNDCANQFSENAVALDEYNIQQVIECTPYFGDNNSAGFGDAESFFGLVGGLLSGSLSGVGLGTAGTITTTMLDQLDSYWDCVGETEQGYNEALDALGSAFDDCWSSVQSGDYN